MYFIVLFNKTFAFLGYDSCTTALYENNKKTDQYTINIAGTSKSIKVICKLDKNVPVTLITHDNNVRTYVKGYEASGSYRKVLNYTEPLSDISLLINNAKTCKQFIRVECFHARLNTFAWLNDRNGRRVSYWAGGAGIMPGCECGKTSTCIGKNIKCNCDANIHFAVKDEGYITNKDVLPITAVNFGDTGHSFESINYTIGDVECLSPPMAGMKCVQS